MKAICRTATLSEIRLMLNWAAKEGWNPGLDDADAFYAADPDGYFIAEVAGRPAAAISVVNHSSDLAYLGLYLCRPDFRGRGIGYSLWAYALKHAGTRTVGLDGVPEQEGNYAKSGFVWTGRTRRLCGTLPVTQLTMPTATAADAEALAKLDREAVGFERKRFIQAWTSDSLNRKSVILLQKGVATGFATVRRCLQGCKIGPVVAPNVNHAFELALQAAGTLGETEVIIDVPDHAADFGRLLREGAFVETFSTARMYKGTPPAVSDSLQAIATMELG